MNKTKIQYSPAIEKKETPKKINLNQSTNSFDGQKKILNMSETSMNSFLSTSSESSPKHLNRKHQDIQKNALNYLRQRNNLINLHLIPQKFMPRKISLNTQKWYDVYSEANVNKYNSTPLMLRPITPQNENTPILKIRIKLSRHYYATFTLYRFSDLFVTLQCFFRNYNISKKDLLLPLAYKIFSALTLISRAYNKDLSTLDQSYLFSMYLRWQELYNN